MACALKRVIVAELQARKRADPHYPVPFILVCKRTIRLRIEKQYSTIEEAASRYSISTEAILREKQRHNETLHSDARSTKRPAYVGPLRDSRRAGGPH
ncbi:unnamed protein product [Cylicocyclus nassatus]|uniref:Uncharacterized protein n=1 Tax=Cylicocyclus nassatus TaxID=53992 RepID=A0AA36H304_CYLNA|nr:unnamed protein product [Cylicocyclus nassatus]